MEKYTLSCEVRDPKTSLKQLRSSKRTPAVVYGEKHETLAVSVDNGTFSKVLKTAGQTSIIELEVNGTKYDVVIHEVQNHPVTDLPLHIDFFLVSKTKKAHFEIPLVLTGVAPASKEGALIEQSVYHLSVKCLAKDLVHEFTVDVSSINKVGDSVHVSDLAIDRTKFEILTPLELAVVGAHLQRVEVETTEAPVVDPTKVETVTDIKKAEKEAAAAAETEEKK